MSQSVRRILILNKEYSLYDSRSFVYLEMLSSLLKVAVISITEADRHSLIDMMPNEVELATN